MARKQPTATQVDPADRRAVLAKAGAPWLGPQRHQLLAARRESRLPHGILLHGTAGAGQTGLALWTAHMALCENAAKAPCGRCASCILFLAGNHPDFYLLELEEKASFIKVDQVRELCAKLALRSFRGAGKVGVIDPADKMNIQANNALLKTLEEPPEETLLILSASRLDRLPRTVISRCQRMKLLTPATDDAIAWLNGTIRRDDWKDLLGLAAGAPFRALEMAEEGAGELSGEMGRILAEAVGAGPFDPLGVAASWSKDRPADRLAWLERWVEESIRAEASGGDVVNNNRDFCLPTAGVGLNIRAAFALLDRLRDARALLEGSLNTQLMFEDLLVQLVETLAGRTAGRTESQG
jgi:DNA polymerase-3 subunit delta'